MTALEFLNNAPGPKGYDTHRQLATASQHRQFRLPDLIIAATAELAGATVLHADADCDRIAAITGQAVEWVAAKGTL